MTYDEMIANGAWGGAHLDLRKRMAEYLVDGVRLGEIDWQSRSGSRHDTRLHLESSEPLTAAQIIAMLGYSNVAITSKDPYGKKLEKPDLDVEFADGSMVGVETADVTSTAQGKHESEAAALVAHIRDLADEDPSFASAFGNNHVTVFLAGPLLADSRIKSRREANEICDEIIAFILSGEHLGAKRLGVSFSNKYPTLQRRGATWYSQPHVEPYFDTGDGGLNPGRDIGKSEVLRVLGDHRNSARNYRKMPLWLMLVLTGRWEFLRDTVSEVEDEHPPIDPFDRCYIIDDAARLLEIRRS